MSPADTTALIGVLLLVKDELIRIGRKVVTMFSDIRKRCRENRKARNHFEEFKDITLSSENIFILELNPLGGLLNVLNVKDSYLSEVQTSLRYCIDRRFRCYRKRLERFDGTKEDFELLAGEFEDIFYAFKDLFIKPLEKRRDKIASDDVIKEEFNKFVVGYDHLRWKYIDYGKKINKLFGTNVIGTNFEQVLPIA